MVQKLLLIDKIKTIVVSLAGLGCLALMGGCTDSYQKPEAFVDRQPQIFPDYSGIVFPVNIAPMNFRIQEEGEDFQLVVELDGKQRLVCRNKDGKMCMSEKKWKKIMADAAGKELSFQIAVKHCGVWKGYKGITNSVSRDSIDRYLAYRLLYPGYELWNEMGIYQRDLNGFEETAIMENREFGKQCVNCHTFKQNNTSHFMFHVRGKTGGTVICRDGSIEKINSKPNHAAIGGTYSAWHPNGKFIAMSMNNVQQFFHSQGKKQIEVADLNADMGVYDIENHQMLSAPMLSDSTYMETFPNWSPDGRVLYFCRAKQYQKGMNWNEVRYDLCKVEFSPESRTFGTPECVYAASDSLKSVSFPRVSPDGRYLLFTESDYGNFSIWHPESDLMLMDLKLGVISNLKEVNSNQVESFHTWSSSGKWFVFSSKRLDGLWARPFFAHFNPETGKVDKPFVLPQENPDFYSNFTRTYNLPELITSPIENQQELLEVISSPKKTNIELVVR